MKIAQLIEAKYQSPTYRSLSNEKIIELFFIFEPEMSENPDDDPKHYYPRKEIHIWDKGPGGGEVPWLVVYRKGTHRDRDGTIMKNLCILSYNMTVIVSGKQIHRNGRSHIFKYYLAANLRPDRSL